MHWFIGFKRRFGFIHSIVFRCYSTICIDQRLYFVHIVFKRPSRTWGIIKIEMTGTKFCKPILALAFGQYILFVHIASFSYCLHCILVLSIVTVKYAENVVSDLPSSIFSNENYFTKSNKIYKYALLHQLLKFMTVKRLSVKLAAKKFNKFSCCHETKLLSERPSGTFWCRTK